MVSIPTEEDVGATGTFPVQKTGKDWFLSWFLRGDGWCQQAGTSHGARRYPPQGFPETLMQLCKTPLHTYTDPRANRGIWETFSQSSPECQRTPGSSEKGSQLSAACNGNSRGDTSPGSCREEPRDPLGIHQLSKHLLQTFWVPALDSTPSSLLPTPRASLPGHRYPSSLVWGSEDI